MLGDIVGGCPFENVMISIIYVWISEPNIRGVPGIFGDIRWIFGNPRIYRIFRGFLPTLLRAPNVQHPILAPSTNYSLSLHTLFSSIIFPL
uniref:Uncharacterized protein n=1 Tax=Meloidogyne enterolobii TaxID=390850 RepID=A0A6V7V7A6_MELEN|nr:unnamed protein product [Meloidogyne enterolobii]